ncbi:MAG: hypothetical protein CL763_08430 [Chloroflexi bacterium]|nr:hypothetical protein [Chloroflexota bacterium]
MNSRIIIGTWPLSGDYGKVDSKQVRDVLEYCYENGIREFDTAPNYGDEFIEKELGNIFHDKEDVLINTKMGNFPFNEKSYEINDLKKSFNNSLDNLKRESINTLFLHNPRKEIIDYTNILNFMNDLKDVGIINFIGLSKAKNFNYEDFVDLNKFDVIQEDINLLSLEPLKKIKQKQNILMARSPLASGLLSGNITNKTIFPKNDHRSKWLYGKRLESLVKRTDEIKKLSGMKLSELSMRFLFSQKEIDKIIFGVKTKEHVKDIIFNSTRERLEETMVEKLFKLYKEDFGLIDEFEYVY